MAQKEPGNNVIWRDRAWGAVALIVAAATISAVADAGVLVGALYLLAGFWLVVGAWRRTVWGCPFSHQPDGEAPCPRHGFSVEA